MSIRIIRAGQVKNVNEIAVLYQGRWRPVLLAQILRPPPAGSTTPVWEVAYDKYQRPVTGLRGVTATHASCTIAWTAPLYATTYQVTYRARAPGTAAFGTPVVLPWTSDTSQPVPALVPNMEYTFTVVARRIAPGGAEIISIPSEPLTLDTGYDTLILKNPSYSADPVGYPAGKPDLITIKSSGTYTWSKSYNWGASSGSPHVRQGYLTNANLNARGGVSYSTARTQLGAAVSTTHPGLATSVLTDLLNTVTVVDTRIAAVYRYGGGTTNPTIRCYASKLNFSSGATAPGGVAGGTYSTFSAPLVSKYKYDVAIGQLTAWAKEWIKSAPVHNGILTYNGTASGNNTTGHNGYCILRGAQATYPSASASDWLLKLWVKWNYTLPAKEPAWIPTRP